MVYPRILFVFYLCFIRVLFTFYSHFIRILFAFYSFYSHFIRIFVSVYILLNYSFVRSLALLFVIFVLFSHGKVNPGVKWNRFIAVIPVYRAVLIPLLAVWLWGVNVYIWSRKRY